MSKSSTSRDRRALELLAPAGNWECAKAAIENGADAIYFGLQVGFNARARADNFTLDELDQVMQSLHERSVLGYVTLNTLVFTDELPTFEKNVKRIAEAGVDAVLVQDIGAATLIRDICPELAIHASTQMTMASAETIAAIESLGIERVVLARELSIDEIRSIHAATEIPLECFVHGALCVAYSGQCLTSESLGGRSANRGQCAQACRLDYRLHVQAQSNSDIPNFNRSSRYFLSPQDLAAHDHIPALIDAGICSFKIEGRLKTPEYVANTVSHYRAAIDGAVEGRFQSLSKQDRRELEMSFSRGFTPGWLEGCNHKRLVPGASSAKRGVLVGTVVRQLGERVTVMLDHAIGNGDGIVFEGDRAAGAEVGGRVYEVFVGGQRVAEPVAGRVDWLFEKGLLKNCSLKPGQRVWQTDDPQLNRKLRGTFSSTQPRYRRGIAIEIRAAVGEPLVVRMRWAQGAIAAVAVNKQKACVEPFIELQGDTPLVEAQKHPATVDLFREQFGRLGGTPFHLESIAAEIVGKPMVALSQLGALRKRLVESLSSELRSISHRNINEQDVALERLGRIRAVAAKDLVAADPNLHVMCRSLTQLQAVLETGIRSVYVEFHDIREYREAVKRAKDCGANIQIATLRIQKPGEIGLFHALAKHETHGWLVRNLAALRYAQAKGISAVGDFSLNVTNPLTADWLKRQGCHRLTASYDLNRDQLSELCQHVPSSWLEIVIYQHIPMFHMEHCVFCTELSPGINKSDCGRPCDRLTVQLEDRIGVKHTLQADIGCRNTLYNGTAQSGAECVAGLLKQGIRHFRVELLHDMNRDQTKKLIELHRALLAGQISGTEVWRSLKADNRVGVTRGTMEQPRNPLAIL